MPSNSTVPTEQVRFRGEGSVRRARLSARALSVAGEHPEACQAAERDNRARRASAAWPTSSRSCGPRRAPARSDTARTGRSASAGSPPRTGRTVPPPPSQASRGPNESLNPSRARTPRAHLVSERDPFAREALRARSPALRRGPERAAKQRRATEYEASRLLVALRPPSQASGSCRGRKKGSLPTLGAGPPHPPESEDSKGGISRRVPSTGLHDQDGSPAWTRTTDLLINSQPLYRLSYRGARSRGRR